MSFWIRIVSHRQQQQPGSIIRSATAVSPCISPLIICSRDERIYLEHGHELNLAERVAQSVDLKCQLEEVNHNYKNDSWENGEIMLITII